MHGCIARRKAAAKYGSDDDDGGDNGDDGDNDDDGDDDDDDDEGSKNCNIECNIYRYGVMGDDREALEMLGEEVKRSR